MATVKLEEIVDHLDTEVRRALEDSVHEILPNSNFDSHELYHAFKRAISRNCNIWEQVPDQFVEKK